jgi:hypothetical protein
MQPGDAMATAAPCWVRDLVHILPACLPAPPVWGRPASWRACARGSRGSRGSLQVVQLSGRVVSLCFVFPLACCRSQDGAMRAALHDARAGVAVAVAVAVCLRQGPSPSASASAGWHLLCRLWCSSSGMWTEEQEGGCSTAAMWGCMRGAAGAAWWASALEYSNAAGCGDCDQAR